MEALAQRIKSTLQTDKQCFVRPDELQRAWPSLSEDDRERVARQFARENGWRIFSYHRVLGAMFVSN